MPRREPSKLEMQVLGILWKRGPSTVRELLDQLPDGKTRAYTTVLTILQVMEKKGLLTHSAQGNAHVYEPKVSRQQALGPVLRSMVSHIFAGSPSSALQHLLAESDVTREELDKIKELIAEHERAVGSRTGARRKT